jgi:hypothetical protein
MSETFRGKIFENSLFDLGAKCTPTLQLHPTYNAIKLVLVQVTALSNKLERFSLADTLAKVFKLRVMPQLTTMLHI